MGDSAQFSHSLRLYSSRISIPMSSFMSFLVRGVCEVADAEEDDEAVRSVLRVTLFSVEPISVVRLLCVTGTEYVLEVLENVEVIE